MKPMAAEVARATPPTHRGPDVRVLPEPALEFRHGQQAVDPHAGLALFGPYDADMPTHPGRLAYGVIGTTTGVRLLQQFMTHISDPVVSQPYRDPAIKTKDSFLWPAWPGFEAAFHTELPGAPAWSHELDNEALVATTQHKDKYKRAFEAVNQYLNAVRIAHERDEHIAVLVCVVPEVVWENCRPLSVVLDGTGIALSKTERAVARKQVDMFSPYAPEELDYSVDFRRQLKARAMQYGVPIQIVRESTLRLHDPVDRNARSLTVLSDRAWNLATALYYKAGGKPWRLSTARDGVCYVGIAFRHSEMDDDPRTACCAAQMFLDSGDGVVFRGEFGPWYSPEKKEHHLSADAAAGLLAGVIGAYAELKGQPLQEIFLHSRSDINAEEFAGYQRACPPGVRLVGVRVRRATEGVRLYRGGQWPVLRNTLWVLSPRTAYLWAAGFKPALLTYDGSEVPVPLRIDIQHGTGDIVQIAQDITGLTKLNYNTCKLGDGEPVTVHFSDAVGEILVGNPKITVRKPAFKFYV